MCLRTFIACMISQVKAFIDLEKYTLAPSNYLKVYYNNMLDHTMHQFLQTIRLQSKILIIRNVLLYERGI